MTDKVDCVVLDMDRYNELLEIETLLNTLYAAGVANWDGYEMACGVEPINDWNIPE